jgi:hypothetical protein
MKKSIAAKFIICIFTCTFSNAQTIKTYSGAFEEGKATYQFYENKDFERVYHGKFNYTTDFLGLIKISGNYNDNFKHGLWSYYREFDGLFNIKGYNTSIKGNYIEGLKEGQWNVIATEVGTGKIIAKSKVNFKKGILVGSFVKSENGNTLKGQFDNNGFFTGTWIHKFKKSDNFYYEDVRKYNKGVLYFKIERDLSTGTIIEKIDNKEFVDSFFSKYDSLTNFSTGIEIEPQYEIDEIENRNLRDIVYCLNSVNLSDEWGSNVDDRIITDIFKDWYNNTKTKYLIFMVNFGEEYPSFNPTRDIIINKSLTKRNFSKKLEGEYQVSDSLEKINLEKESKIKDSLLKVEIEKIKIQKFKKIQSFISNGDSLFKLGKFIKALNSYENAGQLEESEIITSKITETNAELSRIRTLETNRRAGYFSIKNTFEKIKFEMPSQKSGLEDIKSIYGERYGLCINEAISNFNVYNNKYNALVPTNEESDSWTNTDQQALDLVLKFNEESIQYDKFHEAIKTALANRDRDQLKLLKSSEEPNTIVKNLLNYEKK